MSRIESYNAAGNYYNTPVQNRQRKDDELKADRSKAAAKTESTAQTKTPELSEKAQALLDKLKDKYKNMDFMVADFSTDEEARDILSRGTKEFSVLLTADELEKMAEDEDYAKENMGKIEQATEMAKNLAEKLSPEDGEIARVGISFNKDGSVSYFAELEKSSERQAERIAKSREEKAAQRKEDAKKAEEKRAEKRAEAKKEAHYGKEEPVVKRTTVEGATQEELLEKIKGIDWSKIGVDTKAEGAKVDFSV